VIEASGLQNQHTLCLASLAVIIPFRVQVCISKYRMYGYIVSESEDFLVGVYAEDPDMDPESSA
jgi:hypothetical protein